MKEAEHIAFDDRAGFHAAVLRALACCRHEIVIIDRDLRAWPFETPEGDRALADALRRGARLRLLLGSTDWIERHGTRFMRTRRAFDSRVDCRRLPATLRLDDSALLGDRQHSVRRTPGERFRGRGVIASPSQVEQLASRLDAAWDECESCLPSTVLGLTR